MSEQSSEPTAERCPGNVPARHEPGALPDHCPVCGLLADRLAAVQAERDEAYGHGYDDGFRACSDDLQSAEAERAAARAALDRVKALHKPIRVYDECEHDDDHGCVRIEVYDYAGCSESVVGWGCSTCCYDDEYPREGCPHGADHTDVSESDSCPTARAAVEGGRS